MTNTEILKAYLALAEEFCTDDARYYELIDPSFQATVFPNALAPAGRTYTRSDIPTGMAAGRAMLRYQRYTIDRIVAEHDVVVAEMQWEGEMAIDAAGLKASTVLRATVCCVAEFSNGKIVRQRNYDCYEPHQ